MHGLTRVPNWVGTAVQAIRNRLLANESKSDAYDRALQSRSMACGRTRIGHPVNAFPGYAFAASAKSEPGFIAAFVDVGPSGTVLTNQIASSPFEKQTHHTETHGRDDVAAVEEFAAPQGATDFRNHPVNLVAEDGRLDFPVPPEPDSANDNIGMTFLQTEREAPVAKRSPVQLPLANDNAIYEKAETDTGESDQRSRHEPEDATDGRAAEEETREVAIFESIAVQKQPAIKAQPAVDTLDPESELPHRTAPLIFEFGRPPIRFPETERGGRQKDGSELDVSSEPALWNRHYLDFGGPDIGPESDGKPVNDALPMKTLAPVGENAIEDQCAPEADVGDFN